LLDLIAIIAEKGIGYDQRRDIYTSHYYLVWDRYIRLPHDITCGRRFLFERGWSISISCSRKDFGRSI